MSLGAAALGVSVLAGWAANRLNVGHVEIQDALDELAGLWPFRSSSPRAMSVLSSP